jgi:hypothetical protein
MQVGGSCILRRTICCASKLGWYEERGCLNTPADLPIEHPHLAAAWSSRGAAPNVPSEMLSPNSLFGALTDVITTEQISACWSCLEAASLRPR